MQSTILSDKSTVATVAWWSDYAALTKPRILVMILFTVAMGLFAFAQGSLSPWIAFHALFGTALIAASASILNQWLEQDYDFRMPRTRTRPLPSGRLTSFEAAAFGWVTGALGFLYLWSFTNVDATLVGFATWISYVWIYTPLKSRTWWNTAIGTLPGALPVLIGWSAAGGSVVSIEAWLLTAIVILWQFPHFMSIAWLYRDQYDLAGYRMLTNVFPSGIVAGWHAVIPAAALIPVSIFAVAPNGIVTAMLAMIAVIMSGLLVWASIRFLVDRSERTARQLLHNSLIYLPAMMLIVVVRYCL